MPQTFKIKNSTEAAKVPGAGDLAVAELAINLADRKLFSKDASGTVFEIGGTPDGEVPGGGTDDRPDNPDPGELFFDTDLNALLYWDGSNWVQVVSETPGGDGDYVVLDDGGTAQSIVGGGGLDVIGGITSEFGTNAAQLGNIAPLNDWSCYPARA